MVPLLRAIVVWSVMLTGVLGAHPSNADLAGSANSITPRPVSILTQYRAHRAASAQQAQVQTWSNDLTQGLADYQARLEAAAEAKAEADRVAALNNHPPPPPWIGQIIYEAFSPLGQDALTWALRVAWCESRYHPNSVNSDSGASGLFQFMPSTWGGTPWAAQSPFDPVANAQAAAWLYARYGPVRWTCQ